MIDRTYQYISRGLYHRSGVNELMVVVMLAASVVQGDYPGRQ